MIKQCKGKALDKIAKSKLISDDTQVLVSTKFDGNYIQIHKNDREVRFFTSGGKEFYLKDYAEILINKVKGNCILEAEYLGNGNGKLGDRVHASTGTYRANFKKGIESNLGEGKIIIFDFINLELSAEKRDSIITKLQFYVGLLTSNAQIMTFIEAKSHAKNLIKKGYEGVVVRTLDQMYQPGKRLNEVIKIKYRPTADLLCIGTEKGEGKYIDMIGSLILEDSEGRQVSVGSGLDDIQRGLIPDCFIGQVVEIEYEQILDTYIQPIFVRLREDKEEDEID